MVLYESILSPEPHEDGEHVIIVFDRPENIVSNGKPSGLCILKSDIVKLEEVSEKEGE